MCKQVCESDFKVNMQIYQCVERPHVLWNLKIRSKTKLTEERFRRMVLFKTILDYLLVAKKTCEFLTCTKPTRKN